MSETALTRDEVASAAGVDARFVDELVKVGIIAGTDGRFSEADVRRCRILHSVAASGLPMDKVGEAFRRGEIELDFVDDPAYAIYAGLMDKTFSEVSADTGIPMELLFAVRESMGSAQPGPGDRLRTMEMDVVDAVELQLRHGVPPASIERSLRAFGDSLRRMAEVEADWWMRDVIMPVLASGGTGADIGPRTRDFSNAFGPANDRQILAIFHGHQSNAWIKNFLDSFEAALSRTGLLAAVDRPPAICFLDLSGYTRLTEERGDAAAADLAGRLARLVQRTSAQHGGKPIKWLGDGVMFHFREPGPGVLAALEMVEGAREADLPPAHVGLHAGPVLFQEGDYFGRTVNIASRIADYARQGEVLVSDEVVAASNVDGVRFDPIGRVELKGLTEAVSLHVARRST